MGGVRRWVNSISRYVAAHSCVPKPSTLKLHVPVATRWSSKIISGPGKGKAGRGKRDGVNSVVRGGGQCLVDRLPAC